MLRRLVVVVVGACSTQASSPVGEYEKHTLDRAYRAEGVAIFDVDRDGRMDIVTDQFWYAGGVTAHEVRTPETFDPASQFAHAFGIYPRDIDGDGWTDMIVAPHPTDEMLWYENPKGTEAHWTPHVISPVNVAGLETPIVVDLFGDGGTELVMSDSTSSTLGWYVPQTDPTKPWVLHPISAPGFAPAGPFVHGIGVDDVDGDGKLDVLTGAGWFQQTSDRTAWMWHAFAFGFDGCSRMFAYDLDGDGGADVVCGHPHDYGLHFWRRAQTAKGLDPTFADVIVDASLSQLHALRLDDLDGDGTPEIVTGKRWWAHGPALDPGAGDPALLVYYRFDRATASFTRHVIDEDSGVGAQFAIADVDADGKVDIVTSNKKGLFYFRRR